MGQNPKENLFTQPHRRNDSLFWFNWAAGSDAAGSMIDKGVVKMKNGQKYIDLTVNKRYITLAPTVDLVGLTFKLEDPNNLLDKGREGITLVILEKINF